MASLSMMAEGDAQRAAIHARIVTTSIDLGTMIAVTNGNARVMKSDH